MERNLEESMVVVVVLTIVLAAGVANADIVAYWEFEDLEGSTVRDSVGQSHGTLHGNPVCVDGYFGRALRFDGFHDYVTIQHNPVLDINDAITIAAWIKVDTFDKEWQAIITKGDSAWRIARDGTANGVNFGANIGATLWSVRGSTNVNDGNWHHTALAYDGSKACLYVDGDLDDFVRAPRGISKNTYDVCIGENLERMGRHWSGLIDDVVIFNEALSQAGIKQLYELGGKSFISKPLRELSGAVREAEAMLEKRGAQKAITFIEKKVSLYEESREKALIDHALRNKLLASLYFVLARAKDAAGAPSREVTAAFQKSASLSFQAPNYVPALLWLFRNTPAHDYVGVIKKSMYNTNSTLDHIHRVAKDFESYEDWAPFELFLDTVFSEVSDTASFAEAIAEGLKEDGVWANWFLRYSRSKPELTQYVIETFEKRAREHIDRNEFSKAAEIYRTIVSQCPADQGKSAYELRVCECIFNSGQYASAISELDNFIRDNKATNRTLIKQATLLKGRAHIQLSELDRARDTLLELMIDYPETKQIPEANFLIGYCDMLEGRLEKAKEALSFVVKDYPQSPYASKAHLCLRRIERMIK